MGTAPSAYSWSLMEYYPYLKTNFWPFATCQAFMEHAKGAIVHLVTNK